MVGRSAQDPDLLRRHQRFLPLGGAAPTPHLCSHACCPSNPVCARAQRLDVDKKRVVLPEEAERMGLDVETFMSNRMLEILRENEVLYEGGVRSEKRLGGMLGGG